MSAFCNGPSHLQPRSDRRTCSGGARQPSGHLILPAPPPGGAVRRRLVMSRSARLMAVALSSATVVTASALPATAVSGAHTLPPPLPRRHRHGPGRLPRLRRRLQPLLERRMGHRQEHRPPGSTRTHWQRTQHLARRRPGTSQLRPGQPARHHRPAQQPPPHHQHQAQVVLETITATSTAAELRIDAELDTGAYPLRTTAAPAEFHSLPITPDAFHGDWNNALTPAPPS